MKVVKHYNNMDQFLVIGGERVSLSKLSRSDMKGIWLDAVAKYAFWKTSIHGEDWLVLDLKDGAAPYTPVQCAKLSEKLQEANGCKVLYYFDTLDFNKRERLMAQGVFFVVGRKYVHIPGILINSRGAAKEKATELTAVAQYMLLYHLQERSLEAMSARDMEQLLPYKYVTITLAMQVLEDLEISEIKVDEDKTKRLHFTESGRELYERILPLLMNPVKKSFYCDEVHADFAISGINALSRYSMLAPERMQTLAVEERGVNLKAKDTPFIGMNSWDGAYRIEIWKYPPIAKDGVVDKLSLALTLMSDDDPRVQKELKQMIESLW